MILMIPPRPSASYFAGGTVITSIGDGTVIGADLGPVVSSDNPQSPLEHVLVWNTNYILVRMGNETVVRYTHVLPNITIGQPVAMGQPLGTLGGYKDDPHLHLSFCKSLYNILFPERVEYRPLPLRLSQQNSQSGNLMPSGFFVQQPVREEDFLSLCSRLDPALYDSLQEVKKSSYWGSLQNGSMVLFFEAMLGWTLSSEHIQRSAEPFMEQLGKIFTGEYPVASLQSAMMLLYGAMTGIHVRRFQTASRLLSHLPDKNI